MMEEEAKKAEIEKEKRKEMELLRTKRETIERLEELEVKLANTQNIFQEENEVQWSEIRKFNKKV